MDTQTQIDRLIELAIIQRSELKQLVEQLPQLREHLNSEVEKVFDETEPQLRAELEEWTTKQTADKTAALGAALEAKIADLAKSLEVSTQARYNAIIAEREENSRLATQAEAKIAEHAASLPGAVKEIVSAELARFPRAGEIEQLRKEFAEPRGLNPRGKWQAGESYNKLDFVTINGDSYASNIDNNRTRPSRSSADWTLVAARGTGGGGGPTSLSELTTIPSDGDLLIGSGTSWVTSNLTAGAGISITVGPGAITISATDGDITLDDGTAASPSLHFTNDPDTGIYRPAANTLGISVSGTQVAYFDENGLTVPSAGVVAGGSFHGANGNANNPSYSFSGDQDTGFFRHAPNEIGIALGGTQYATLTSTTFSITPVVTMASSLRVNGTTDSSSKDTGAIVTEGGLGVEKSASIGGNLTVSGTGLFNGDVTLSKVGPKFLLTDTSDTSWSVRSSAGYYLFKNETANIDIARFIGSTLASAKLEILATTASSSTTTGALVVSGGVGAAGAVNVGGNLTVSGTVQIDGFSALFKTQTATLATIGSAYAAGHGSYRAEISFGAQNYGSSDAGYIGFRTSATYNTGTLSEVARFAANGNLLIGTTTDGGNGKLQLAAGAADKTSGIGFWTDTSLYRWQAGGFALDHIGASNPYLSFRANGTENGSLQASGGDFYITAMANKNMYLRTNGGTTALTLDSSQNATFAGDVTVNGGNVGVGTSALANYGLDVRPTALSGAGQAGLNIVGAYTSSATSFGYGVRIVPGTAASSFTMVNGAGVYVDAPSIGASATVTNQIGVSIANQGAAGITNAYGIDIAAQSGASTTNIGLRNLGATVLATPAAAVTLATNSTMTFELTSNTSLKILVRGTDGNTKSVSLTLA